MASERRACATACLVAGAVAAGFAILFARVVWHIGDEGSILQGAERWAEGEVPYRDFFEVMGPFTFLPGRLAFEVLGVTWWASRIEMIAGVAATAVLICWLTAQASPSDGLFPALLYVVVLVPLWPGVNYHVTSNVLFLGCVAAALAPMRRTALLWAGIGAATGAVTLMMLQKGFVLLFALVLSVLLEARGRRQVLMDLSWLVGGTGVVLGCTAVYFVRQEVLREWIYATVIWPATQYHTVNRVVPGSGLGEVATGQYQLWGEALGGPIGSVVATLVLLPTLTVPALALVGLLALTWRAIQRSLDHRGRLLALTGVALAVSESHRPDLVHLIYASPALLVPGWSALRALRSRTAAAAGAVLSVGTVAAAAAAGTVALTASVRLETAVGPVRRHAPDPALAFLMSQAHRDEHVFVYPYYPMYYFLAGVRNPTRYSIFMYHINTTEQALEIVRHLQARRVRLVLWDTVFSGGRLAQWFPGYLVPPPGKQPIEEFLRDSYEERGVVRGYRILERQ